MVEYPFEKFLSEVTSGGLEDVFSINTTLSKTNISQEVIKFTFNGNDSVNLESTNVVNSDYIDINRYKQIEIVVNNRVDAEEVALSFTTSFGASGYRIPRYYDWEKDRWEYAYLSDNSTLGKPLKITKQDNDLYLLSTHPDLYWLKDFKGSRIRLNVKALTQPNGSNNKFEAWIVGVPYA